MNSPWSEDLQKQTLRALQDLPVSANGKLHMKHKTEGHGHFNLLELAAFKFVLHREGNKSQVVFLDEQAVVAAGWAID